jgi:hypothetical protein
MKYFVVCEETITGIETHLAGIREDGDPVPEPTTAAEYLEVPAA